MQPSRQFLLALLIVLTFSACSSTRPPTPSTPATVEPTPAPVVTEVSMEDRLVDAYIASTGGLDAIRNMKTVTMKAEISMMGMNMPLVIYSKRPSKMRSEVDVTAMNMKVVTATDGVTAWTQNPMVGPTAQVLPAEQAKAVAEQADIDGMLVGYKERGYTVTYVGEEPVRGKPAHKLKVDRPNQSLVHIFLDAETHLQVKQDGEGIDPQSGGRVQMATYMGDYRAVEGVMMPFMMEVEMGGNPFQKMTMSGIEVNTEVDDSLFKMPVSVN
ncbi:MAG: hypothetical protein SH809_02600 [Rhodothermales bacterium]|nr:hypothetical protein [Rhodothermales bacterium]